MLALIVLIAGLASSVHAQPGGRLPTKDEAQAIFQSKIKDSRQPIVVAMIHPSGQVAYGYGVTSAQNPKIPDGDTVFEIGSITKVFTGLLLAQMVVSGQVSLDDPVEKYLPPDMHVPNWEGKKITLRHLATHSSGLPRQLRSHPQTMQAFCQALAHCKLRSAPGAKFLYSNLGAALLGEALVHRAAAKNYEELVLSRICRPLGMNDTFVYYRDSMRPRSAQPRDKDGNPKPRGTNEGSFAAGAGSAGGLKTTANDMMKFMRAYMEPDKTPFAAALRLSCQRQGAESPQVGIGLFWDLQPNGEIGKKGKVNGFLSNVIIFPQRHIAYFVSRSGDGGPRNIISPFMTFLLDNPLPQDSGPTEEDQ